MGDFYWKFICPRCEKTIEGFAEAYSKTVIDLIHFRIVAKKISRTETIEGDETDWDFTRYECPNCGNKLTEQQIVSGARKWFKTLSPEEIAEMIKEK